MKRIVIIALALLTGLSLFDAAAQDGSGADAESVAAQSKAFSDRYDLLVSKLGLSGVGIETLLDNWEKVDPDNHKLLVARYGYYLDKSQTVNVVYKPLKKYLGADPLFTLKDSLGNDANFFQETAYDDSLFSIALRNIDKAVRVYPKDLDFRLARCEALISYERESPDMALVGMEDIVDRYYADPSGWDYAGEEVDRDSFIGLMSEYCFIFYNIGTPASYNAFKALSEKMLTYENDNTIFLSNIGTYYLIAAKDQKQAFKYYNKVLKISPNDYTAAKNCVLICRQQKNTKLEKKYLPALIASTTDERERMNAEARLKTL